MREVMIENSAKEKMENLTSNYENTENGGFLIGRLNPTKVYIVDVTDAGELAKRSFNSVIFDNATLTIKVNEYLENDLFIIGTWHSHPKGYSLKPSSIDLKTMAEINSYFEVNYYPIYSIVNLDKFNRFKMCCYELDEVGNLIELKYSVIGV
ncbi:MAG: Mov34/MPN/PAD-1 family protein [Psychrobacillus sp.]